MHRTALSVCAFTTKAGDVGSHAVYPRASNVARRPPEGKDDASGSPWISSFPENWAMAPPPPRFPSAESGQTKDSCFSAVAPVRGWNQWV